MIARYALIAGFAISGVAFAQGAGAPKGPPSEPGRIGGTITAIDSSAMTLKDKGGVETRLTFTPDVKVLSVRPAKMTDIKAGTAAIIVSKPQPDGKESIFAIRLIEPDAVSEPEGSRTGPLPGSTMIIGKVTKATPAGTGLELDVAYAGEARHLLLPSNAMMLDTYVVGQAALKAGTAVESQLIREADGTARTGAIMLMPPGGPPGGGPPGAAPPH